MKAISRIIFIAASLFFVASCAQTTEKYAQKEHGKKFGSWEMNYNAGDYDVYWPSLKLSGDVKGKVVEITTQRNWWTDKVLKRDTTRMGATLTAKIISVKSKNDAKYYNSIRFKVFNSVNEYRPRLKHQFIFNEGQKDSLSFSGKANDDGYFVPEREVSEKIVTLFAGKKPVHVTIKYTGNDLEGGYLFQVDGCPKLKQALEVNQERKVFANKEFGKADRLAEKEFMKLFD